MPCLYVYDWLIVHMLIKSHPLICQMKYMHIACCVSGGPLSHPIVHLSHQAGAILPQAEVEEEIRDTPLRYTQALPSTQQSSVTPGAWPKDMPRLAFEITSEDGFSCRAQSMEGKSAGSFIKDAH